MIRKLLFLAIVLLNTPLQAEDAVQTMKETHQQKIAVSAEQQRLLKEVEILEKTLQGLTEMKNEKKKNLSKSRQDIALKLPLIARLGRENPLHILADPSVSQNTLRGLVILRSVTASLKHQIQHIQAELNEIATISTDLETKSQSLAQLIQELEVQKVELTALQDQKLATITKEELKRLADEEDINTLLDESRAALSKKDRVVKTATAKKGLPFCWLEQPVVGKMIKNEALQKEFDPKGQGIIFETKKNAEVLAPSAGIVVFKGPFKSQGDILILDHGEKVYTVLMGMHKIDAEVGQNVYAGHKLGSMAGYGKKQPKLYLELRVKGKPIDPKPYFTD